jgi:hypothetical protein
VWKKMFRHIFPEINSKLYVRIASILIAGEKTLPFDWNVWSRVPLHFYST